MVMLVLTPRSSELSEERSDRPCGILRHRRIRRLKLSLEAENQLDYLRWKLSGPYRIWNCDLFPACQRLWTIRDLNPWPPPCHGGALPTELMAHGSWQVVDSIIGGQACHGSALPTELMALMLKKSWSISLEFLVISSKLLKNNFRNI